MAFGSATFTDIGGAVGDLFGAQAAGIKADADRLKSGADLLQAQGARYKAQGDLTEADLYDEASGFATQNIAFTQQSTAIQATQADRQAFLTVGGQKADFAAAGMSASGSALDIMRSSASQAALSRAVLVQQGGITEAGYQQQADSYKAMSGAARFAASADEVAAKIDETTSQIDLKAADIDDTAAKGMQWSAGMKFAAAAGTLL